MFKHQIQHPPNRQQYLLRRVKSFLKRFPFLHSSIVSLEYLSNHSLTELSMNYTASTHIDPSVKPHLAPFTLQPKKLKAARFFSPLWSTLSPGSTR